MKKIGIVTLYYRSLNCGGNLQAYALVEFLRKMGYDAEQISFEYNKNVKNLDSIGLLGKVIKKGPYGLLCEMIKRVRKKRNNKYFFDVMEKRKKAFDQFNQNIIRHSERVYDSEGIRESNQVYDVFITGSDQVWNLKWYSPILFLDFVASDKGKISYAASISMKKVNEAQLEIMKKHLKDFKAISVREEQAVKQIENVVDVPVYTVLDPTLLLGKNDWEKITSERVFSMEYIFCYFLGNNKKGRLLAKKYAEKAKLPVVYIPFANGDFVVEDLSFGDVAIEDASPQMFLSLVKHARCVFTDSFHATVFSHIFEKKYFVFPRNQKDDMTSRIANITRVFEEEFRFCNTSKRSTLQYILDNENVSKDTRDGELERLKKISIGFLKDCL